jgi:aspartate/methionine/tyrosine aminotransferase
MYSPLVGRELNPDTQFQVTSGASGGLFATILGVVSPGDEVIVLAPWFDIYSGAISRAGAKLVEVPLELKPEATTSGDYYLDLDKLEAAITGKTKVLLSTQGRPKYKTGNNYQHSSQSYR